MHKSFLLVCVLVAFIGTAFGQEMWFFHIGAKMSSKDFRANYTPDEETSQKNLMALVDWGKACTLEYGFNVVPTVSFSDDGKAKFDFKSWFVSNDERMASDACSKSKLSNIVDNMSKSMFGKKVFKKTTLTKIGTLDQENCTDTTGIICGDYYFGGKSQSACTACSFNSATMTSISVIAMTIVAAVTILF